MNNCNSFYERYHKMEDQQKHEKIGQQLLERAITEYSEDLRIWEDIDKLKTRIPVKGNLSASAQKSPHLYTTRAASTEHNMEALASVSEAQKISVDAIDSVSGEISTDLRRKF